MLAETFCARQNVHADVFEPTTVVVQSLGMGQWLKHQMAAHDGIAANVNVLLPAKLIWQLYQAVLTDRVLPAESPFSRHRLAWQIMHLLPQFTLAAFKPVQQYINRSDTQLHLYQLGDKIADLFDKYLVYRPEWLAEWESDPGADHWQAILWRALVQLEGMDTGLHRANLHAAFLDRLENDASIQPIQSGFISIFGLSSLPPIHLQTLQALAPRVDVDIYFLNPCQHYWGDIVSEKDRSKRSIRQLIQQIPASDKTPLADDDYLEVGNPLLSSMGKQGREFLELLLENNDVSSTEAFLPWPAESALHHIKNDILNLECGGVYGGGAGLISVTDADHSIQIHVCHSALREIEVLFDQLHRIALDTEIEAGDIIVMAPDISDYVPFIRSVFANKLHCNITDQAASHASSILSTFATLLALPDLRCTASEVMELLETPAISRKFGLDEAGLSTINCWLRQAGIRWELDGNAKAQHWQMPASNQHTFLFGLKRLLLGFALQPGQPDDMDIYQGIVPFDLNPADNILLGSLCQFIDYLTHYRSCFSQPQSVQQWQNIITGMTADLFQPEAAEELSLNLIRAHLDRLSETVTTSSFDAPITPQLVRYWLAAELSQQQQSRAFVSGGVTFANLVPMRSIPFKVVCLIGMNDQKYPRQDTQPSFDLMAAKYRKGDRSRRQDDRYLFLEALLSAESCFYVSYQGRSQKNNSLRPASVLVTELDDYLHRVFQRTFTTEHPLQPFSHRYYQSTENRLSSFNRDWFAALTKGTSPQPFVDTRLPVLDEYRLRDLSQLIQFIKNPARYFLQTRLGIYFTDGDSAMGLADTEPFQLDGLEAFQLADSALDVLVARGDLEKWQAWVLASGQVISAKPGFDQLAKASTLAKSVYKGVAPFINRPSRVLEGAVQLHDGPLTGSIPLLGDEIIRYQAGRLHKHQQLAAWVQHLFYQASGHAQSTHLIAQHRSDKNSCDFRSIAPVAATLAREHLQTLADRFAEGLSQPAPFMSDTSWVLFEHYNKNGDALHAIQRAAGAYSSGVDAADPYYRRVFNLPADLNDVFLTWALDIYQPMLQYWEKLK